MTQQDTRFENEFEQELSATAVEEFNTLQSFSVQPTSLLETTLIDTLGLSMHNAVTNQQQSHMTTAASVTNACARLLQTKTTVTSPPPVSNASKKVQEVHDVPMKEESAEEVKKNKSKLSLFGFLTTKKGAKDDE